MADKLILNANLICKADRFVPKKCAVEKVIEVSDSEFKTFIENPMKRNYYLPQYKDLMGYYDGAYHGILFVNAENGDGFFANSEGCDYARYSQYIPNARVLVQAHEQTAAMSEFENYIEEKIDDIISASGGKTEFTVNADFIMTEPKTCELFYNAVCAALKNRPEIANAVNENGKIFAEKSDLIETRFYCPLKIEIDDGSDYPEEVCSENYVGYDDEINDFIRAELNFDKDVVERGLAAYLHDENLDRKVYSIMPMVETRNGDLYGMAVVKSYGKLDKAEMIELVEYVTGQYADGFGESLEQRPIKLGEDEVYISFWNSSDDYFLKPESEVFPSQNFEQTMRGI